MSNNDFMKSLKNGGFLAIDVVSGSYKGVTVIACIKPNQRDSFTTIGEHVCECNFFIGYIGKFVPYGASLTYYDETCKLRRPTLKEYLKLLEELKKRRIGYNKKKNETYIRKKNNITYESNR